MRGLVELYEEEARALLPDGATLFDAHVHVGRDIDGMVAPYEDLVAFLERWGVARAFAFCMDEPDREPAFRAANDRTLAAAERSDGRLVPFVRLDLAEEPIEEATRAPRRRAGSSSIPGPRGSCSTTSGSSPSSRSRRSGASRS